MAELIRLGLEMRAIDGIAEEGMASMGEVDPDLMGPAGLELAGQEARHRLSVLAVESFPHLIMGHGLAAALAHGHLLAGLRMPVDRRIDRAAMTVRDAPGEGEIAAPHLAGPAMIGELRRERGMGAVILGDDHQPGRVLVEPVHDAGPLHTPNARKARAAMGDQRVHQRATGVPRCRMDDEARRLVYD